MRTNDPMSILNYCMPRGVPLVVSPIVPLMRTRKFDCDGEGTITEPALCWQINGEIHVHPERYEEYFKPLLRR